MKNIFSYAFIVMVLFFATSCEKIVMKPNPEKDNISIYNEYWKLIDEKYAMWKNPDKKIDKTAVHSYTMGLVTQDMTADSLFGVLEYIVHQFKDGHTYIEGDDNTPRLGFYDIEAVGEKNFSQDIVDNVYLKDDFKTIGVEKSMKYKLIDNGNIGYIELRGWLDEYTNDEMDEVLNYFSGTKGIIFDVRENGGGNPFMANFVARRFSDKQYFLGTEHFKTGPGETDFSPTKLYNNPSEFVQYTKPVMVLTNHYCFSATTTFIYYLNPLPNVTFIGSRTGGGSGSTADGFLANGWHWQMSTSEFIDWEGRHLDNGFEPDIYQAIDYTDITKDELIERAIVEINSK